MWVRAHAYVGEYVCVMCVCERVLLSVSGCVHCVCLYVCVSGCVHCVCVFV